MNKSYVLLYLYEDLKEGKGISMETCMITYGISVPTFRRYIAELRDFLLEKHGLEIKYYYKEKLYKIV